MLMYKKISNKDLEFSKILNEYLEVERSNPVFSNKLNFLKLELEELSNKFEEKDFKYTTDELEKYICMDRKYPYEDIYIANNIILLKFS
jgi:hypothetical protein